LCPYLIPPFDSRRTKAIHSNFPHQYRKCSSNLPFSIFIAVRTYNQAGDTSVSMPLLRHEKIPLCRKDRGLEPQQQHSVNREVGRGIARTGPSSSATRSGDGDARVSPRRSRQQMNLTQTNAAKAAVIPKPSAALTRFSPDPNMPADALHPEFDPHLPLRLRPHTDTTYHQPLRGERGGAYRLNRRLPLRRIDRRAVRSRPGAPIWWGAGAMRS